MLVNGTWQGKWDPVQEKDDEGRFVRQTSSFRHWVTPDGSAGPTGDAGFKAEAGRYHLYVAYICPWACRTLIVRQLKGLEDFIGVSVVEPVLTDQGWRFGDYLGATEDSLNGMTYMHQLYTKADATFTGRATVPVLWDKKTDTMVNNESADIIRMLNSSFDHLTGNTLNLVPEDLESQIDDLNARLYDRVNNGVYKSGFASSQAAYDEAVTALFEELDQLEQRLAEQGSRYLFGDTLTETDIRLFVTLIRFDLAYHGIFKCNLRTLKSYTHLHRYMVDIYNQPGIAPTVNFDHIKQGYYSIKALNPTGIVPAGPDLAMILG